MSTDRRLWSPEVLQTIFRRINKLYASFPSTVPRSGPSYPRNFVQKLSSKGLASNAARGTSHAIQVVQPSQPWNQQQLLESAGWAATLRGPQASRQQVEGHLQIICRQVLPLLCRTDNSIKNHFYSTIRRCLRRINKFQGEKNSTLKMRNIKPYVLSKILADRSNFIVM